jgi:Domain of unknown function (DUF4062)
MAASRLSRAVRCGEMRIYVSSTFNDLQAHRTACIRVLRQLGHQVISMEDYVAESSIPVEKVVADVKSCELYVVLVAWRYGYVPDASRVNAEVKDAVKGETSITDYEYLAAVEGDVRRLAFLVHERAPWPPHLMDGFGATAEPRGDLKKVLAFRERLQRDQMVAFFEAPADLEARLSAAVASVGLRSQMLSNSVKLHRGSINGIAAAIPITDSGRMPLDELVGARPAPEVAIIDIQTTWWSTRLYILAAVADLLTDASRIVINEGDDFVGMVSTTHIRQMLRALHPEIDRFEREQVPLPLPPDPMSALSEILRRWREVLQEQEHQTIKEQAVQMTATRAALVRWLGDGMFTGAVRVVDPDQTTVLDLLRVLDYPSDYVPIVREPASPAGTRATGKTPLRIINKASLNAQLARNHIDDTLSSLGLRLRP